MPNDLPYSLFLPRSLPTAWYQQSRARVQQDLRRHAKPAIPEGEYSLPGTAKTTGCGDPDGSDRRENCPVPAVAADVLNSNLSNRRQRFMRELIRTMADAVATTRLTARDGDLAAGSRFRSRYSAVQGPITGRELYMRQRASSFERSALQILSGARATVEHGSDEPIPNVAPMLRDAMAQNKDCECLWPTAATDLAHRRGHAVTPCTI